MFLVVSMKNASVGVMLPIAGAAIGVSDVAGNGVELAGVGTSQVEESDIGTLPLAGGDRVQTRPAGSRQARAPEGAFHPAVSVAGNAMLYCLIPPLVSGTASSVASRVAETSDPGASVNQSCSVGGLVDGSFGFAV